MFLEKEKSYNAKHSSSKEGKKEKKKSRSPSPTKQKYPANWSELLEMRLELPDLKTIKNRKSSNGCIE